MKTRNACLMNLLLHLRRQAKRSYLDVPGVDLGILSVFLLLAVVPRW